MKYKFLSIVILIAICNGLQAQNIDIKLVNKAFANGGLTWTFDLQATALAGYVGTEDSWGTMNVRFDLSVQSSATVQASSSGSVIGNFATSASVQPSVPGSPASGYNAEFGIFLDRTPSSNTDLTIGVPTNIASFTVNFNMPVTNMDIVDPRDPATQQGSFYVISDDGTATRKPFVLEGPRALPVKLTDFNVSKLDGQKASDLRWHSSSEVNFSHYEVERSEDGFNFTNIGNVAASGYATWNQKYQFIDNKLPLSRNLTDIYYYRLKMVDLDGRSEYSEIRSVRFDFSNEINLTYYPNPTNSKVFVNMSIPHVLGSQTLDATITDKAGKLVMTKTISTNGITEIDLSQLPTASYNFNVEYAGKQFSKTVIKTN